MPKTVWTLELKNKGSRGAKALARDLKELDATLRSLGESSKVLDRLASDAGALRGARVRIRGEKAVGAERVRQERAARTEMTDSERVRRAVVASEGKAFAVRARENAQQQERRQRGAQELARLNANAFRRDQADARRQQRDIERRARLNANAFRRDDTMRRRQAQQSERSRARQARQNRAEMADTAAFMAGGLGAVLGVVTGIVGATMGALAAITQMIGAVAELVFRLSLATLEMIAFREASLATLRAMARDNNGNRLRGVAADRHARDQFRWSSQFARETPLDVQQVIDLQRQTSAAGFAGQRNRDVVMAAADVGAFNQNDPSASGRFLLGLSQLKNASTTRVQDLRQTAAAAGLGENDLLQSIARAQGVTQRRGETADAFNARLQTMQRGGQIRGGETAVEGVLAALRERNGGALGSYARSQGQTLLGTLSNLKGAVFDFVTGIEGIEDLPGLRALKKMLNELVDVLTGSGPTAERLRAIFVGIVDEAATFAASFGGRQGISRHIERAVTLFEEWAPFVRDIAGAFSGGVWQALEESLGPVLRELGGVGRDRSAVVWARDFGRGLGHLLAIGIRLTAIVGAFTVAAVSGFGHVLDWLRRVDAWFTALPEQVSGVFRGFDWSTIGRMIADGITGGLYSQTTGVLDAVRSLAGGMVTTAQTELDIHSPSRVFRDLGAMVPEGMAQGIDGGARSVERAMGGMVAPPTLPGLGGVGGALGMGGIQAIFYVTVEGRGDAESGREAGESCWNAFVERFETASSMQGA